MNDITTKLLQRSLDLRMQKHAMHVANVANANVPDYKAKAIDFEDRLAQALEPAEDVNTPLRARELALENVIPSVEADLYQDPYSPMKPDGNTVNAETEQVEIAKNTLLYEASIQLINKKLALQKYVLGGGG